MVNTWNAAQLNEAANNGSIGGSGSELPEVSASDNGDVLGVVDGAWAKMALPSYGVDYTTNEVDTGSTFLGSKIYAKTYEGSTNGVITLNAEQTGGEVLGALGYAYTEGGARKIAFPSAAQGSYELLTEIDGSSGLILRVGTAFSGYKITVFYTKPVTP